MRINWRRILRPHNILATVFIFLVLWILSFIHLELHFLDPFTHGIKDYDVTDIVYSRLRSPEVEVDDRIVLVNTGTPERALLQRMLERIEAAQPKAIGIDVLFREQVKNHTDTLLQRTLKANKNIVLGTLVNGNWDDPGRAIAETGSDTFFTNYAYTGFTDFPVNNSLTIRVFRPRDHTARSTAHAFAVEIARLYDPESTERLTKRNKELERIHFTTNIDNYFRFEPDKILDTSVDLSAVLKGKIVLMGYLNDFTPDDPVVDRFFTPLNPRYTGRTEKDMYGVVLHANIIRMLLDDDYINTAPGWLLFVFAFVLVYANTFFFFWNYKYFWYFKPFPRILYRWGHLVQVVEIALLFLLTAWIFYAYRLRVDFTLAIVALLLAFDLCIIYYYLRQNFPALDRVPEYFPEKKPVAVVTTNEEDK